MINIKRSPLFYIGDKYKILPQIKKYFPNNINNFFEPFLGGGSVFLNVEAKNYHLNDLNETLINIHHFLKETSDDHITFFNMLDKIIDEYGLSKSYIKDVVPDELKRKFKKTYYSRFNKQGYLKLRDYVNSAKEVSPIYYYVLIIYGFNRMVRFNKEGEFNIPVGNVDFNKNVYNSVLYYLDYVSNKNIKFSAQDYYNFLLKQHFNPDDFVYLDPPYLIAGTEYNKSWSSEKEKHLLNTIDELDKEGVKFGLSNILEYNNNNNDILRKWSKKYKIYKIDSNYINYFNNRQKNISEVYITNL